MLNGQELLAEGLSFLAYDGSRKLYLEDVNGGCPNVTTSRVSYLQSVAPSVSDPFYYYKRTFTFQASPYSPLLSLYASQPVL